MYVYYILLYNSMLYTKSNTRGFFLGSWLSSNRCLVGIPIYYVPTYGHFNFKIPSLYRMNTFFRGVWFHQK